jgi:hypothetical protein
MVSTVISTSPNIVYRPDEKYRTTRKWYQRGHLCGRGEGVFGYIYLITQECWRVPDQPILYIIDFIECFIYKFCSHEWDKDRYSSYESVHVSPQEE